MRSFLLALFCAFLVSAFPADTFAQSAKKLIKEARSLSETNDFKGAIDKLNQALQVEPTNGDAIFLRGTIYRKQENYPQALSDLKAAAELFPKSVVVLEELALSQIGANNNQDALITLDRMIGLSAKTSRFYHLKEETQIKTKNYEGVIQTGTAALAVEKEDDYTYYQMARAVDLLGNTGLAENYYTKALAIALDTKGKRDNPQLLYPYYCGLADVQGKLSKDDQAISNFSLAIKFNANDEQVLIKRGIIYSHKKEYQNAIQDFNQAISIQSKSASAFYQRGLVNQLLGQFAAAINDFNQAILIDAKQSDYFASRAECYLRSNSYADAVRDYKQAISLNPENKDLVKLLADAKQKNFDVNKETNNPVITIMQPKGIEKEITVRADAKTLQIQGVVTDASWIRSLVVDGQSLKLAEEVINPEFSCSIDLKDKNGFKIQVTDAYLNTATYEYTITRTEVGIPEVQFSKPFQTLERELFIENTASIMLEGRIRDESLIKSIIINGTSASFPLEMKNPPFQALVNIGTKDTLVVHITDVLGNELITAYKLIREDTSGSNPMGTTWVVFIENSNYKNLQKLEGPGRDINDMKTALSNYKVDKIVHKKDATKADLDKFFSIELRDQIQKNRVKSLIIWYAGHGKFLNETGYWIPVDGDNYDEYTYYSVNQLRASMQAYTMLKHVLVISDACESGPAFYMAMRDDMEPRLCDDWEVTKFRSAQVITSANKELSSDNSLFTTAFANTLNNNPNDCISVETIALKVMGIVKQNQRQTPKFGKIKGLDDENGSFFFIKRKF